jgi:amphi-Trp domain-containing protein
MEDDSVFSYVGLQDPSSAAEFLGAIADSLRDGSVSLTSGDQGFQATPSELVRLRIEAKRSEETVNLMVVLSWSEALLRAQTPATLQVGLQGS